MFDEGEWMALITLWLGLITVLGVYAIRILMMLRAQRAMERHLRLQIALRTGRSVREAARADTT